MYRRPVVVSTLLTLLLTPLTTFSTASAQEASACVDCHAESSPQIVSDWQASRHAAAGLDCAACHGTHTSAADIASLRMPGPELCGACHAERLEQFTAGKHAKAWVALQAMPTTHAMPVALNLGLKGCGGCHKIGLKSEADLAALAEAGAGYGRASCDACHTRHTFSAEEARQPEACQTCHMGFDHPQWEMWSSSKHGVRHALKRTGALPATAAAPTCQTCHMPDGDHEVRTAWGFLAVRLPLPEDPQWKDDQVTILQALGVLDPDGQPTGRLDVVKAGDVARLTQEDFDRERGEMLGICADCHSASFAAEQLARGDEMIREADHLLAEAIRVVAGLYEDGTLRTPPGYAYPFPDLLTFHDAPTVIEQRLFEMHLKHRMRAFQGVFHANPDYALWYGWSEMVRDLQEIREMASDMREDAAGPAD
ncbi:MAG: multiheme c-type cytochrome [Gemmatimonadota bacterium]|nr:multiheme c-type cytochrome [Gemmatimonadota bacterium]